MTCLLEQGRRRHLGSRREAFFKVHECPVEATKVSEDATPADDSENQVLSQKPGLCLCCCSAPCTAAGTGHLPGHPVDQPPVSHPSISDFPILSVLPISCCACSFPFSLPLQPKFPSSCPLPRFPLGQAGCEGCARMCQIADNVWLIGMTIEVAKSDAANKGQCPLVIPVFPVNPLGSSV